MCKESAVKQCLCSKSFLCELHCGRHASQRGNHQFVDLLLQINPSIRLKLEEELSSRIRMINESNSKIATHACSLINQIEILCSCALESLHQMSLKYSKLLTTTEYTPSEMEEIEQIQNTLFNTSFNSTLESVNHIEEYFSQQFCKATSKSNAKLLKTHSGPIYCIAVTSDKKMIFSGGEDNTIKQWSVERGNIVKIFQGHSMIISSIASSNKDNNFLISGSFDRTVRIWNINDARQLCVLNGHMGRVMDLALSDDQKWIASGSADCSILIWSVDEQRLLFKLAELNQWARAVKFYQNSLFSGCNDGKIIEWNINSRQKLSVLETSSAVYCLDISSNLIACGCDDGKIQLWKKRKLQV
jgi:WD40 repeat protein